MFKRHITLSGNLLLRRPKPSSKSASEIGESTWMTSKEVLEDRIMWDRVCRFKIVFLTLAEIILTNRISKEIIIRSRETKKTRQLLRVRLRNNNRDRHNRNQGTSKEIAKIKRLLKRVGVKKSRNHCRIRNLKLLINSDTIISSIS